MEHTLQSKDPSICHLQEKHFRTKDRLESEDMKKKDSCKWKQESGGSHSYTRQKVFETDSITKGKEEYHAVIKRSIQEDGSTLINIYTPNTRGPKYVNQILTDVKEEIDSNTIIVVDIKTPTY